MKRKYCSVCNCLLKNIFVLDNYPIKLSCTNIPIKEMHQLSFSQCISCNTIQLDELIPLEILYSDSHNYTSVGKIWENYFKLLINNLNPIIKDKNILEIGCPSGKIACNVHDYKKWFIVEPNKNKKHVFNENIIFIERFFDCNFSLDIEIDVIIHSHLFEHIYKPNDFLKKCNEILKSDGVMIFGVPNMKYFTENIITPFLGVFFEHTIFLNKKNICYLLKKNNFDIVEIIDYENHSTIYKCKKKNNSDTIENTNQIIFKNTNYIDSFTQSLNLYKDFINKCNNIIKNTSKDVYIFGASYNTQFLLSLGIEIKNIKGILDNSKEKQNKFFYGYDIRIYDPEILKYNINCIVILRNGYYTNEIIEQILKINKNIEIII